MARSENNLNAVFQDTADAIRSKTGKNGLIVPRDFADEIDSIETGIEPSGKLYINENGTHDVTNYAEAEVDVKASQELTKVNLTGSSLTQPGEFLNEGHKVTIMNVLSFYEDNEGIYADVSIDCSDMPETNYESYIQGKLDEIGIDYSGSNLEVVLPIFYFNRSTQSQSFIEYMIFRFVNVSWSDSGEWDSNFRNWLTNAYSGIDIYTISGHKYNTLGWNSEHVEISISGADS